MSRSENGSPWNIMAFWIFVLILTTFFAPGKRDEAQGPKNALPAVTPSENKLPAETDRVADQPSQSLARIEPNAEPIELEIVSVFYHNFPFIQHPGGLGKDVGPSVPCVGINFKLVNHTNKRIRQYIMPKDIKLYGFDGISSRSSKEIPCHTVEFSDRDEESDTTSHSYPDTRPRTIVAATAYYPLSRRDGDYRSLTFHVLPDIYGPDSESLSRAFGFSTESQLTVSQNLSEPMTSLVNYYKNNLSIIIYNWVPGIHN